MHAHILEPYHKEYKDGTFRCCLSMMRSSMAMHVTTEKKGSGLEDTKAYMKGCHAHA